MKSVKTGTHVAEQGLGKEKILELGDLAEWLCLSKNDKDTVCGRDGAKNLGIQVSENAL